MTLLWQFIWRIAENSDEGFRDENALRESLANLMRLRPRMRREAFEKGISRGFNRTIGSRAWRVLLPMAQARILPASVVIDKKPSLAAHAENTHPDARRFLNTQLQQKGGPAGASICRAIHAGAGVFARRHRAVSRGVTRRHAGPR